MTVKPGPELVREVRSGLIRQGSSLKAWCNRAGVSHTYIHNVLMGGTNGPGAQTWRARVINDAKITGVVDEGHRLNGAAA